MHPILIAELAADRHAELMRTAAAHRRFADSTGLDRRTVLSRRTDRLGRATTWLKVRLTATRSSAELCCA